MGLKNILTQPKDADLHLCHADIMIPNDGADWFLRYYDTDGGARDAQLSAVDQEVDGQLGEMLQYLQNLLATIPNFADTLDVGWATFKYNRAPDTDFVNLVQLRNVNCLNYQRVDLYDEFDITRNLRFYMCVPWRLVDLTPTFYHQYIKQWGILPAVLLDNPA